MAVRCYDDTTVCSVQQQCTVVLSGRFGTLDPELSQNDSHEFLYTLKMSVTVTGVDMVERDVAVEGSWCNCDSQSATVLFFPGICLISKT